MAASSSAASNTSIEEDEDIEELATIGTKRPRQHGQMDKYFALQPDVRGKGKMKQTHIDEKERKRRRDKTHEFVSQWAYEAGIPFHALTIPSFDRMCEAIAQYGPGYKGPTRYQLSEPLLKKAVEKTNASLNQLKEEWKKYGCSIMTDAWTNRRRRSVMNLCVHCCKGTSFYKSVEDSAEAHTGEHIFKWIDKCIEEIGPELVVQVVTDNASANMQAKLLLKKKRPLIFWTSCAAHTIDLMLEDIGKIPKFKEVIKKARDLTVFIYSHHRTLALMRHFTQKKDIVRPGITRFATSFLTLGSLQEKKEKFRLMFTSDEWTQCKWSKTAKGKIATATVMSVSFWNGVALLLKVFGPLFRLLRVVDSDKRPSMGYIIGGLVDAKKEIMAAFKNNENQYKPIIDIIEKKGKDRLDSPLHYAAYFFNPYYFYRDDVVQKDARAMAAVIDVMDVFFPEDDVIQDMIINVEVLKYRNMCGLLGKPIAIRGREKLDEVYNPVHWWFVFGGEVPYIQAMAQKLLTLTSSSSGCERNWSSFEGIHTKKRNRLVSNRLNDLVFVQFNARIASKRHTRAKEGQERDILLARDPNKARAWMVEGVDEEDEEVPDCEGLTWNMVEEATGARELLRPRTSARRGSSSTLSNVNEEEALINSSDEETEEEEEKVELDDGSDDNVLRNENFDFDENEDE